MAEEFIADCGKCPWQRVGDDRVKLDDQAETHTGYTQHPTVVQPLTAWQEKR